MKAKIIFDLENEEDKERFKNLANEKDTNQNVALWKFSQILRNYRKYGGIFNDIEWQKEDDRKNSETAAQRVIETLEGKFYSTLEEFEVELD